MITHGTTYSHTYASYLQLNIEESLRNILNTNSNIIRLCCYWNEIQTSKIGYNFNTIKKLLDICNEKNQQVIVTIGMKAPRFPEFYIPSWMGSKEPSDSEELVLRFIQETINTLKDYPCIKYWQIENEPLDPVWPDKRNIDIKILKNEIELVRRIDNTRKIIVTMWGNSDFEDTFHILEDIGDIVGIDLYYKQYITDALGVSIYAGPKYSDSKIRQIISNSKKPVWITELQAEPWEKNMDVYKSENTKSMNAEQLQKNFARAKSLNPDAILFWGSEYWLWRKSKNDPKLWDKIRQLITQHQSSA